MAGPNFPPSTSMILPSSEVLSTRHRHHIILREDRGNCQIDEKEYRIFLGKQVTETRCYVLGIAAIPQHTVTQGLPVSCTEIVW